uniref:Structural polyprotein n=1 Tax=Riboviria sp. TaxID=2585031 RepID=A0A893A3W3_9VIRU|nr:MAG: hypothetical protein 2 [Riboviria sp.]
MADSTMVCNTIDGVEINANTVGTGVSNFVNEACSDMTFRGETYRPLPEMITDNTSAQDINSFFSRPRRLWYGVYNAFYNDDKQIFSTIVGSSYMKDWHYEKMKGAFGFRATFCYKIVFTATPFHGGIMRFAFAPTADKPIPRGNNILAVSQLPGVDIDLSESTSATIKIPWVSPLNFLPVQAPSTQVVEDTNLGVVYLSKMTEAIVGAGAEAPTYTIWTWLEDLELIGARASQVTVFPEAQAGKFERHGKSASSKESDAIPGNVSNILSAGSKLSMWLGSKVPLISSYAGPVSWVLRESAKVAASYGWSKPIDSKPAAKVIRTLNVSQWNSDTPYTGHNLGLFADNAVCAYPGFAGTDLDEMSFEYVLGVSAAISAPTYAKTDGVGKVLYTCSLAPDSMKLSSNNVNNSKFGLSYLPIWVAPVCGLAQLFQLYRGGFKFRIKLAKTCYHTGRLLVGFNPTNRSNAYENFVPADSSSNSAFYEPISYKSVIWDLRDDSVLDFECPFIAPVSYLPTGQPFGDFFIRVLDELECPDTVSATLRFVVEVSCLPDFEFAIPVTPDMSIYPLNGAAPLADVEAQSGKFEPTKPTNTVDAANYCIGERIRSIKQLLLRASLYTVAVNGSTTQVYSQVEFPTITAGAEKAMENESRDYLNWLGSAYIYRRGSVCVSAVATSPDTLLTAYHGLGTSIDMSPVVTENVGAVHVKMPYYSAVSRSATTTTVLQPYDVYDFVTVAVSGPSTTRPVAIYRSVADDFQLGAFVGFPPITVSDVSANTRLLKTSIISKI